MNETTVLQDVDKMVNYGYNVYINVLKKILTFSKINKNCLRIFKDYKTLYETIKFHDPQGRGFKYCGGRCLGKTCILPIFKLVY